MALSQAPEPDFNKPADVVKVLSDPKATDNQVFNAIQRSAAIAQNPVNAARIISDLQSRASDTHLQLGTRQAALLALSQINRPLAEQVLDNFKDVPEFKSFFDQLYNVRRDVSTQMLTDVRSGLKDGKLNDAMLKVFSHFTVDATAAPLQKFVTHNGKRVETGFSQQFDFHVNYQTAAHDAFRSLTPSERNVMFGLMERAEGQQIPVVINVLANLARTSDMPEIREAALRTLGNMKDPHAVEPALARLGQFVEYPQMALYPTNQRELEAARKAMLDRVRGDGRQLMANFAIATTPLDPELLKPGREKDHSQALERQAVALDGVMAVLGDYAIYGRWVLLNLPASERMKLVDGLSKLEVPAYAGAVLEALTAMARDVRQKPEVRIAAVTAITNINDEHALARLNLLGKDPTLAATVNLAMQKLTERLQQLGQDMLSLVRGGDFEKLSALLSPHQNPRGLVAFFRLNRDDQTTIVAALGRVSPFNPVYATSALAVIAQNEGYDISVRRAAVTALGEIKSPAAYVVLAELKANEAKLPGLKESIDGALAKLETMVSSLVTDVRSALSQPLSSDSKLLDILSVNNPMSLIIWKKLTRDEQLSAINRLGGSASFRIDMRNEGGAMLNDKLTGAVGFLRTVAMQNRDEQISLAATRALGQIPNASAVAALTEIKNNASKHTEANGTNLDQRLVSVKESERIGAAVAQEASTQLAAVQKRIKSVGDEVTKLAGISADKLGYKRRMRLDELLSGPYFNTAMDAIVDRPTRSGIERVIAVSHSIKGSEKYELAAATTLYQIVLARKQDLGKRAKADESGYRTALAGLSGYSLGGLAARAQMQSGLYNVGATKPSNPALTAMALLYAESDRRISDAAHTAMLYAYGHPLTFQKDGEKKTVQKTRAQQDALTALIATIGDDKLALNLISAARVVAHRNHDKPAADRLASAKADIESALKDSK